MSVVLLAIGDELLRGESREGNGPVLAEALSSRGLALTEIRVIGDDLAGMGRTLADLGSRAKLVVCSGGLGPTDDDVTRQALATAAGVTLERDAAALAALQQRFRRLGREMDPSNARQADIPLGATLLANAHGTAPGFALRLGDSVVACFPGVPREFAGMLADHLDTLLQASGLEGVSGRREVTLRLFGITESDMQGVLGRLPHYGCVAMRSLPDFPEIRLKFAERDDPAGYDALLQEARQALGWRIHGEGDGDSHAAAVLRALQAHGVRLAVAESCTGGLLGHLLTEVPGASAGLVADVVAYANEAKVALLDVAPDLLERHGAVSDEVVRAMAEGARKRCGADLAVATTGIAGPGGGTAEKPVGTVHIAVAGERGVTARKVAIPGLDRWRFKRLVAHMAMADVRRYLAGR